jgi:hypothetical protein
MTAGTKSYMGLAVPINGECTIKSVTAATDILTIEGVGSLSGDYIVCRSSAGTEAFSVDSNGDIKCGGNYFSLPVVTTAITTGLVKGDIYILYSSTAPLLGICISDAGNTCYYIKASTTDPAQ